MELPICPPSNNINNFNARNSSKRTSRFMPSILSKESPESLSISQSWLRMVDQSDPNLSEIFNDVEWVTSELWKETAQNRQDNSKTEVFAAWTDWCS